MLAIKRYPGNPILGPNPDLPWGQHEARNPGVVFDGKKFHLLFTATPEPRNGEIYLGYASGSDGIHFECAPEPLLRPSPDPDDFDHASVEDARITELDGKFLHCLCSPFFQHAEIRSGRTQSRAGRQPESHMDRKFPAGRFCSHDRLAALPEARSDYK